MTGSVTAARPRGRLGGAASRAGLAVVVLGLIVAGVLTVRSPSVGKYAGSTVARSPFPDAGTTGISAGVELRPSEGLRITEPGALVEGLHVRGTVTIAADDVTLRGSLVETDTTKYAIVVESGTRGALIADVEVDNLGSTGIGVFFKGAGTLRGADVHSAADGVRIEADDVVVADSYIHDLQRAEGGHHDTVQIRKGDNVTLRRNYLQAYVPSTDDPMNAAIQIGSLVGDDKISNLVVEDNLLDGGNYTINGGGDIVDSARFSGNHFGPHARYGPLANAELVAATWDPTNVWHSTGLPVR